MTADDVRRIALGFPEAVESQHMGTPDYRVRKRIFATLRSAEGCAVVKLTREQQEAMTQSEPSMLEPVPGGWGRKGWTCVMLAHADEATLRSALTAAWRNVAPKRLANRSSAALDCARAQ
jgi:hypothetical protein